MNPEEHIIDFFNGCSIQFKDAILPSIVAYLCPFLEEKFDENALLGGKHVSDPFIGNATEELEHFTSYLRSGALLDQFQKTIITIGVLDYLISRPQVSPYDVELLRQSSDSGLTDTLRQRMEFSSRRFDADITRWKSLRKSDLAYEALYRFEATLIKAFQNG